MPSSLLRDPAVTRDKRPFSALRPREKSCVPRYPRICPIWRTSSIAMAVMSDTGGSSNHVTPTTNAETSPLLNHEGNGESGFDDSFGVANHSKHVGMGSNHKGGYDATSTSSSGESSRRPLARRDDVAVVIGDNARTKCRGNQEFNDDDGDFDERQTRQRRLRPNMQEAVLPSDQDASSQANESTQGPISAVDFYYNNPANPTVQRYYRFNSTKVTPFIALYKRPLETYDENDVAHKKNQPQRLPPNPQNDTTGLLTRSMVLPSHGTDPTGRWILVSVGGRTGWARRYTPQASNPPRHRLPCDATDHPTSLTSLEEQNPPAFTPADEFRVKEAWMGNHVFLCNGKLMLGSDAPLFYVTNTC